MVCGPPKKRATKRSLLGTEKKLSWDKKKLATGWGTEKSFAGQKKSFPRLPSPVSRAKPNPPNRAPFAPPPPPFGRPPSYAQRVASASRGLCRMSTWRHGHAAARAPGHPSPPFHNRNVRGGPRDDPRLRHHPLLDEPGYRDVFLPLKVHGDAAEFMDRDSLMVVSFTGMLGSGSTRDLAMYMASWPKSCTAKEATHGRDTWRTIWGCLCWSFRALHEGLHPRVSWVGEAFLANSAGRPRAGFGPLAHGPATAATQDAAGLGSGLWPRLQPRGARHSAPRAAARPLCPGPGFRGFVYAIVGDLDFFNKDLGMPAMNAQCFCWLCPCDRSDTPNAWNYFGNAPEATWLSNLRTPDQERAEPQSDHPIFSLPGVSVFHLMLDGLHTLDHGISQHILANTIFTIAREQMPGSLVENVGILWQRMQVLYTRLGIRKNKLTQFKASYLGIKVESPNAQYPCLSGAIKGAQTRALVPVVFQLAIEFDSGDAVAAHRRLCLQALCRVYDVIHSGPMFLSATAAQHLGQEMRLCLAHYSWLSREAMESGRLLWSLVNKHHFSLHLCMQAKWVNPRFVWTYMWEDFVGHVKDLAGACAAGTSLLRISASIAQKYSVVMHVTLTRGLTPWESDEAQGPP